MYKRKFGACILAAGFSSRMGRFKPLLPLNDELVIQRVIRVSKVVGIQNIAVVTGHNREEILPVLKAAGAEEAYNCRFQEGMFTSIQTGIAALPPELDGFFILPVDCPLVTEEILRLLMERFDPQRFTVPCYRGKKGHPLLVPAGYREEILKHNGKGGLKAVTDKDFDKMQRIEVDSEGVVMDMDTPRAYEEILEYLGRGCRTPNLTELARGRRFFLIRHGQIRQHKEKIFLGQTDVPLSEEGREQASEAGKVLAGFCPATDRIYSSDLLRASESAAWIQRETGLDCIIEEKGLREMNLGPWDGKFISEVKKQFPQEYEKRGKHLMIYKMGHGSENFFDLQYRVIKTISKILEKDENKDVILVAHSGVLRAISNNLRGKDISDPWKKMKNGEVRSVEL